MKEVRIKTIRKAKRSIRTRKKILLHSHRPRLSVFRSNRYLYAQVINDREGKTLVAVYEKELQGALELTGSGKAEALGKLLAQKANKKGITEVVFDKGQYRYHGRLKLFAEAARKGGLQF